MQSIATTVSYIALSDEVITLRKPLPARACEVGHMQCNRYVGTLDCGQAVSGKQRPGATDTVDDLPAAARLDKSANGSKGASANVTLRIRTSRPSRAKTESRCPAG